MRRLLSFALALAMMSPAIASAAQAAIGTWLAPEPGQVVSGPRAEVAVGFNTQSELKVTSLELYVDGKFYARKRLSEPASRGVCSFWWDISRAAPGSHDLVVKIFAGDKLISRVSGTGVVGGSSGNVLDVTPPTVVFENIKSGDVLKGVTPVRIKAVDDSGKPPMVSLLVNNMLKMLRNTPPYSYDLDTTTYDDGNHQLTTYAYDQAGNRSDPAVVNVVFSNGIKKPVVAAMTVTRAPESEARPAGQSVSSELPPPRPPDKEAPKQSSAGRVPAANTPVGVAAAPGNAAPRVELGSATASAESASAPAISLPENAPVRSDSASAAAQSVNASTLTITPRAVVPGVIPDPVSVAAAMVDVSRQPYDGSSSAAAGASVSPVAAEPEVPNEALVSSLPGPTVETVAGFTDAVRPVVMGFSAQMPADTAPEPVTSPVTDLALSVEPDTLDVQEVPAFEAEPVAAAPEVREPVEEPVRTALVSDIEPRPVRSAVHGVPPVKKDAKARLEDRAVVKSGKVKARTFFEAMGGVLFWAQATRTVTVYIDGMKIELRVGRKTALVNGTEMKIDTAPYIVNGRTIIDAGIYHQACALVQHSKLIRQA